MATTRIKEYKIYESEKQVDIRILIGGMPHDLIKLIKNRHGEDVKLYNWDKEYIWPEDADDTDAYQFHVCAPLGKGEIFYAWVHEPTLYLLVHEVVHVVGDILFHRGYKYGRKSEEAWAYLTGWIMYEFYKQFKGKIKKE
jgi:hypothetical protein